MAAYKLSPAIIAVTVSSIKLHVAHKEPLGHNPYYYCTCIHGGAVMSRLKF